MLCCMLMLERCCRLALCPVAVAALAILVAGLRAVPMGEVVPVDLAGKTYLITGATSGLGKWHAETLMRWNASLVLAVRNAGQGRELAKKLSRQNPGAPAPQVYEVQMNSLSSVRKFSSDYTGPVDVLVHNAGTIGVEPSNKTGDGFGEVLQVNYLSTFLLTDLLLPRVEASPAGRIVHISGEIYKEFGELNVSAIRHDGVTGWNLVERQNPAMGNLMGSYADSKLAQVLFSAALAKRIKAPAVTHALHPAVVETGLGREFRQSASPAHRVFLEVFRSIMFPVMKHVGKFQNEEDAPKMQIHVSTHPDIQKTNGLYYSAMSPPLVNCGKAPNLCASSDPGSGGDERLQEELWAVSCEVLGLGEDGMCGRRPGVVSAPIAS